MFLASTKAAPAPSRVTTYGVWRLVTYWANLYRQRRDLAKLDSHLLKDIGVTEAEAQKEANRPVWDVPNHWR